MTRLLASAAFTLPVLLAPPDLSALIGQWLVAAMLAVGFAMRRVIVEDCSNCEGFIRAEEAKEILRQMQPARVG